MLGICPPPRRIQLGQHIHYIDTGHKALCPVSVPLSPGVHCGASMPDTLALLFIHTVLLTVPRSAQATQTRLSSL